MSTHGARRPGGWTLGLLLAGCDAGYSLAPTACDDHCHATQRGDCPDDAPADCVRDCENADGSTRDDCKDVRRTSDVCLHAARNAFTCEDDRTRVPDICIEERRLVSECLAPGSGACFDECVRQAETCGENLSDCESTCSHPNPACQAESFAYATCLQDFPVECHVWFEEETRDPEDVPCRPEALRVLACD